MQARFFHFSQACFDRALVLTEADLAGDPFGGLRPDWSLHRPLPQVERLSSLVLPPEHERVPPRRH